MWKHILSILLILSLTLSASASIQIDTSDVFRLTNVDINFSSNNTYDYVDVGGTYIDFGKGIFTIIPTDQINITIITWENSGNYSKVFNESATNPLTITTHIFSSGNFPANQLIKINSDSVLYGYATSDATGALSWVYSGGYSEHRFEFVLGTASDTWGSATTATGTSALDLWISLGRLLIIVIIGLIVSFIIILVRGLSTGTTTTHFKTLTNIGIGIIALVVIYGIINIVGGLMAQIT